MSPIARFLEERLPLSRPLAVVISYLLALVGLAFVMFVAGGAITGEVAQITDRVPADRRSGSRTRWPATRRRWGWIQARPGRAVPNGAGRRSAAWPGRSSTRPRRSRGATLATLGSLVLILILSLYMLMDSERIGGKLTRAVPRQFSDEAAILELSVGRAFGGFLRTQVILAGIQAALVAVVGTIFGIPYLFLVGTLSTLAMLIPFFGPPLALIPPIVAAWIYVPQWFLVITIILVVVQTVVVNWLQPRLMQGALGMHPILVLVGLMVGAQVAGVWGALFGIPIIAVFNVFLNLVLFSELPNAALPQEERLEDVPQATMVKVEREQISDETHPHIHVHRSLRQ